MRPTRRGWTVIALGGALLVTALVIDAVLPLIGAALLGGYLLATQAVAVRAFASATTHLEVEYDAAASQVFVEDDILCTLGVERPPDDPTRMRIRAPLPVSVAGPDVAHRTIDLAADDPAERRSFSVAVRVAGTVTLPAPVLELEDSHGMFTESLDVTEGPEIIVNTRSPQQLHVGEGGTEFESAYGEHKTEGTGGGLVPAELREYIAGDPARRIDWKATARQGSPHIREFESETDRETLLLLDQRDHMSAGRSGERKIDYAREVGLGILGTTETSDDPTGLYAVGNDGLTARLEPSRSSETYEQIRSELLELEPTTATQSRAPPDRDDSTGPPVVASGLDPSETQFDRIIATFVNDPGGYVERIEDDSLFAAARRAFVRNPSSTRLVLITDDTQRDILREIVKLGATEAQSVVVFLLPSILFDSGSLGNLGASYDRYREFEQFRQELARLDNVAAYEVGPGDRLAAILKFTEKSAP